MFENEMKILNPGEKHVACVLLVDVSGSMHGSSIAELNEGLRQFKEALKEDSLAYGCADVSVISFGSKVEQVIPFSAASAYNPPTLTAEGTTAMNEALITALDSLDAQKAKYREHNVDYFQPWLFLLTDGEANDFVYECDARLRIQEALTKNGRQHINFIPMAIGETANIDNLKSYYPENWKQKTVLKATKNNFKEAFVWLSKSLIAVSNSKPGEKNLQTPPVPSTISIAI